MTRIRLSDEDRGRLGLEQEWIEGFSLDGFMVSDAEALEEAGYPVEEFLEELRVPTKMRAVRAAMWLCVRRAGVTVPFADFDFQIANYQREADEQPAGKAPTAARASSKTARATGARSSKRSASSRGKSTS